MGTCDRSTGGNPDVRSPSRLCARRSKDGCRRSASEQRNVHDLFRRRILSINGACRRPNRDRRLPHARRLIAAVASSPLQQLWRPLPGREQVRRLSQLGIDSGRHPGPAGHYSLPVTDPRPVLFRGLDRWHAALDPVERAQTCSAWHTVSKARTNATGPGSAALDVDPHCLSRGRSTAALRPRELVGRGSNSCQRLAPGVVYQRTGSTADSELIMDEGRGARRHPDGRCLGHGELPAGRPAPGPRDRAARSTKQLRESCGIP